MSKKHEIKGFGFNETKIQKEWQGMPEFNKEEKSSYRQIQMHFDNEEDIEKFAKLIGRKITAKTRYIYFSKQIINHFANKRYVDES